MQITTLGQSLYWSYANIGMAHAAMNDRATKYRKLHYVIRSRLYSGWPRGR